MNKSEFMFEVSIRILLFIYQLITAFLKPRMRKIHKEEWWLYSNPVTPSYVPSYLLLIIAFFSMLAFPLIMIAINRKTVIVSFYAIMGYTLASLLNISVTNTLKLLVGRPRPDFYYRCFPEGKELSNCNGNEDAIIDGYKSFPSGHSSLSMTCFGFITLFLIGQLRVFIDEKANQDVSGSGSIKSKFLEDGRFLGCKVIMCLIPLSFAVFVCVSRLMDFHHHFEDISVGAVIGFSIAFLCYRLYFPSIFSKNCDNPKFNLQLDKNNNICFKTFNI